MENAPVIVKTVTDLFTTYDVTDNGYVVNEKAKSPLIIAREMKSKLREEYPDEWDKLEFFDLDYSYRYNKDLRWPVKYCHIAVYYFAGTNEGFCFNVDVVAQGGKRIPMFTGKTLCTRSDAEKIHNAIARVFEV